MNQSQPNRFPFHTQCPRDDGCGVFVLQTLTGMSYDDVAAMIDWGDKSAHYTTWNDLCGVLAEIGLSVETPIKTSRWSDIQGVAIVHVQGDHFMLYDAENGLFYDPAEMEGPRVASARVPTSYLTVYGPNHR
ncbi:hypothetical protein [Rhizobium leguminosarum]|uniref:hypothetical protein n=1 Tax=Rhizobium leguminosarum TaxID=384 RepID=UPI001FE118C1|nr:hypothetical protein [Rhizobium leguminosarum]